MANGILIIDKSAGWTSMDVCAKLRGILKTKKVGHAGTLDPMATGVLPVFVGQATRAVSFAESGEKEYVAGLHLGLVTDTQDTTGTTLEARPVSVTADQLRAILPDFTGPICQVPPMYSAIKIGGQKLYDLARQGKEVDRKPRPVTIYELELVEQISSADFTLRIRCSKGTYVRTLCHDIGTALGCGGCMSSLRRTMAAGFTLAESRGIPPAAHRLPVPPIPRLPHRPPPGGFSLPQRQSLLREGWTAGRYLPSLWHGRFVPVSEPPGGWYYDLHQKLFRSVKSLESTTNCHRPGLF